MWIVEAMQKIRKKNHSTFEPWEAPGNEVWELVLVETPHPPSFLVFVFIFQVGCYASMNKKIYAMGGGSYGKLFDSVECFDPKTQQWTGLCPLKERR